MYVTRVSIDKDMAHPLGNLLRKYRVSRRQSLRTLAAKLRCSSTYVCKIELGKAAPATPAFLSRLAAALELSETEAQLLRYSAAISQRVIALEGELSPKAYEMSHLFAQCLAVLTEDEIIDVEQILRRAKAERGSYEEAK